MIVVDANLLIYASNSNAPNHAEARAWWEARLTADEPVGLSWLVLLAFLRITTNPRIMPSPLSTQDASALVDEWLEQAPVLLVVPTDRHWGILRGLLARLGAAGNLTSDAHLAALAVEHGATLCSTDGDFARFPGLRWENPLET